MDASATVANDSSTQTTPTQTNILSLPPDSYQDSPNNLPTIPVEKGHKILAHRSIRSLLTGSLHNVWDDYRFVISSDSYCEGFKIATSRVKNLSHVPLNIPNTPFKFIFMDIIPHPFI